MPGGRDRQVKGECAAERRERLAAELRANLAKRKAQARARGRKADAPEDVEVATSKPCAPTDKST